MFADCISNDCLQACHLVTNSSLVKRLPDRRDPTQNSIGGSVGVPLADRDRNQPPTASQHHYSLKELLLTLRARGGVFAGTLCKCNWTDYFPTKLGKKNQGQVKWKETGWTLHRQFMNDESNLDSYKGLIQTCQLSLSCSVFLVNLIDAGFHSFLAIIWPHQGHFPVCYRYILCNYRQWLHIILNFKKNMPGSIKCCFFKYGLILKISLISSGPHFRHNSSHFLLQFTIQSKRRTKKFERASRDLWLKKKDDDVTQFHSFCELTVVLSGLAWHFLQLNGSTQRQQAKLPLLLLAYPNITTYLMLHWG